MEKQLQLVTFEQAKKLKQLGFDWFCERSYYNDGVVYDTGSMKHYFAPTVALALKWLRDEKGILLIIEMDAFEKQLDISYYDTNAYRDAVICGSINMDWDKAESAGLDYALYYVLKQFEELKTRSVITDAGLNFKR